MSIPHAHNVCLMSNDKATAVGLHTAVGVADDVGRGYHDDCFAVGFGDARDNHGS